ncbi:uncharacterized protein UTRI_00088 [Ustilago trichophora]|uniref:Uncharacterized protein n=1 Tax=Ustilago trichophora TaxID=86804 RepID=A0A5C3DR17_9BASI|nr:uncharacterized protein UTRI_00088 [Ustilago trichophora]
MRKPSPIILRLSTLATLLISLFTLQAQALDFSVGLVNCTELAWTATLSQTEWSVAPYVELFFVSTQGALNYSLLYSALNGGAFPTPGSYSKVTYFGDTVLNGTYRIGIGLADMNGNILTTTTSSQGTVQVTDVDPRSFTFDNCAGGTSSISGTAAAIPSTASSSLATTTSASSALTTATSAPTLSSKSTVSSSTVPAAASTTSGAVSPVSSLSSASTSTLPTTHSVNKSAIAGGVVGGFVLLLVAFALIRWCSSRRRTRRLSLAAHRMSALRSPSLSEKQVASPKADGAASPESLQRKTARVFASGDTYEVAALGRLSVGSRRRSEGYTPRSVSHGADDVSMINALAEGPSDEQEIQVVRVPFHLTPAQQVATTHDPVALESTTTHHSAATPYLPLTRTTSTPQQPRSFSTDNFVPPYPQPYASEPSHSRSKSQPLVLDLPTTTITPQLSPTGSTFHGKTIRPSHSNSNFKIPRVSVPAYLAGGESIEGEPGLGESISRQMSRSSSMRRMSTGGATFVSVDEDPFVDMPQEHSNQYGSTFG